MSLRIATAIAVLLQSCIRILFQDVPLHLVELMADVPVVGRSFHAKTGTLDYMTGASVCRFNTHTHTFMFTFTYAY